MVVHQIKNSDGSFYYEQHIFRDVSFPLHFHRNYELIYLFSGQLEVIVDGRRVSLEPGDCALCLCNQVHSFEPLGAADTIITHAAVNPVLTASAGSHGDQADRPATSRYFVLTFSPDFVPEFHKAVEGKTGKTCIFRLEGSIQEFFREHIFRSYRMPLPEFYLQQAATNLICGEYQHQVELIQRDNKEYTLMNKVADYISTHFREKLTLRDVAQSLGYDYYYISRLFSQIFSMKFADYLNACRFSAAADALVSTDAPITRIALESGFQSTRTFNDVFLRKTGLSPAQYRKQHRK